MSDTSGLLEILEAERERHPRMTPADVQKLIYQSVLGGDHALIDRERFAAGVRREWDGLVDAGLRKSGSTLQSIDPAGHVARIHLGPCAAAGVDRNQLIDVLWQQPRRGGTRRQFDRRWKEIVALAGAGRIPFSADELMTLGFPEDLPHHSEAYGPTSYRILNDLSDPATCARVDRLGIHLDS